MKIIWEREFSVFEDRKLDYYILVKLFVSGGLSWTDGWRIMLYFIDFIDEFS